MPRRPGHPCIYCLPNGVGPGHYTPATIKGQERLNLEFNLMDSTAINTVDATVSTQAPEVAPVVENLLQYLERTELAQKIIDIAMSQTNLPPRLRDDAAQDIRIMWMSRTPDVVRFEQSQIASYAHQIAKHAALRCRRELGSAVRLPGSAFRKRKDGSTYVQPGTIARPLDWDEMDEWFSMEDQPDAGVSMDTAPSFAPNDGEGLEDDHTYLGALGDGLMGESPMMVREGLDPMEALDGSTEQVEAGLVVGMDAEDERRHEEFNRISERLNPRTREIVARLIAGESLQAIQVAMAISPSIITREIRKAALELPELLGTVDSAA